MNSSSWLSFIPPILVLGLAITTRRIILSLAIGCVTAGIIAANFALLPGLKLTLMRLITETGLPSLINKSGSYDKLYMFSFLILLGILIQLITHSGGIAAYTKTIRRHLTSQKSAETTSLILSSIFFIDDYLSSLTVGSIMRSVTDSFRIPRVKLAYLLDSLSAPLCIIVPATSWAAMVLMQLQVSGVSLHPSATVLIVADPLLVYLISLLFAFYPFYSVFSAWFIVRKSLAFGYMKRYEQEAVTTGNKFGGQPPLPEHKADPEDIIKGSLYDFLLPLGSFIATFIIVLLYSGNFFVFGGTNSFFSSLAQSNSFLALFSASLVATIFSLITLWLKRAITWFQFIYISHEGFALMKNSLMVLLLAWTFGALLKQDLMTGKYLADMLLGSMSATFLPLMFFITATLISATTGSAWGTIIFILPIAVPLAAQLTPDVIISFHAASPIFPIIAAVLSGAVAGGHFSPITDSTVMAATSAGCYLLDHVRTQISYSTPALIGSCIAYCTCGLLFSHLSLIASAGISFITGLSVTIVLLLLRNGLDNRQ